LGKGVNFGKNKVIEKEKNRKSSRMLINLLLKSAKVVACLIPNKNHRYLLLRYKLFRKTLEELSFD